MKYKVASWIDDLITDIWSNKKNLLASSDLFDLQTYLGHSPLATTLGALDERSKENLSYAVDDHVEDFLRNSRTKTAFAKAFVNAISNGCVLISV